MYKILEAVHYLHSKNIVHGKLNTRSIFIEESKKNNIFVNIMAFDKAEQLTGEAYMTGFPEQD